MPMTPMLKFWAAFAVVALVVSIPFACAPSLMLAPPGSSLQLFVNPKTIAAHGGISVVSALVMDATGNPVADGTVVQFFTNLGHIDERGKTNDGVARVNFVSDSRSGVAHITAISGGAVSGGGGGGASPTSGGSPTATTAVSGGGSGASDSQDITIGNAGAARIIVTADPPRISTSIRRTVEIRATVLDVNGNPVPNAPVYFSSTLGSAVSTPTPTGTATGTPASGNAGNERFQNGPGPLFTDNNGDAFNTLFTVAEAGGAPYTVTVTAQTPGTGTGTVSGSVSVGIN
jgi:hypothetical protein